MMVWFSDAENKTEHVNEDRKIGEENLDLKIVFFIDIYSFEKFDRLIK